MKNKSVIYSSVVFLSQKRKASVKTDSCLKNVYIRINTYRNKNEKKTLCVDINDRKYEWLFLYLKSTDRKWL